MLRHALWRSTKAYQQQVRSANIGRWRTSCPTTRMADNVTSQRMAGPFLNGANLRLFPWGGQFHFCSSVFSLGRRKAAWYSIVEDGPMVHALYRTAAMIQTLAYSSNSFQPVGNNLDGLNRNYYCTSSHRGNMNIF